MDEYTGKYFTIENSADFDGKSVNVLEYRTKTNVIQGTCFKCGKVLKKHWWTVQTVEDDLIICDVGNDCVRRLA